MATETASDTKRGAWRRALFCGLVLVACWAGTAPLGEESITPPPPPPIFPPAPPSIPSSSPASSPPTPAPRPAAKTRRPTPQASIPAPALQEIPVILLPASTPGEPEPPTPQKDVLANPVSPKPASKGGPPIWLYALLFVGVLIGMAVLGARLNDRLDRRRNGDQSPPGVRKSG